MLSGHILCLCGDRSSSGRPGYPGTLPAPADMFAHQGGGSSKDQVNERGSRRRGVNRQATALAIDLHKSQEQRQNLSRS